MPKKRKRKRTIPPKNFFVYHDETGTEYLHPDFEPFAEIPESDLPENVEEFSFAIRVHTGAIHINAVKHATTQAMSAELGGNPAKAAEASQELMIQEMIMAIESWSLEDEDGNPIAPSLQALNELQPGWLYTAIETAYQRVNSLSARFRK